MTGGTTGTADGMMSVLSLVTALGAGLSAGVFLAFSGFVMTGLGRAPTPVGVRAMQEVNRAAPTPVFMVVLFGTGLLAILAAVLGVVRTSSAAPVLVAAAVSILVCLALTVGYHVPRNEALALLDPEAATTVSAWRAYRHAWTRLNHVRTLSAALGCALLIIAHGMTTVPAAPSTVIS